MNDQEISELIRELWRPTFVLDDGTRLKLMPVDWQAMSSAQRAVAVAQIKELSIEQLKKTMDGARLHIEFGDVPRELDDALTDIAGADNPDFTWGVPHNDP